MQEIDLYDLSENGGWYRGKLRETVKADGIMFYGVVGSVWFKDGRTSITLERNWTCKVGEPDAIGGVLLTIMAKE